MRYRLVALLAMLTLVIPTPIALADGQGMQGTIVNETTGTPVAGQTVLLHVDRPDGTAGQTLETITGADGGFFFADVALSPSVQFALCATYQNAMYHDPFNVPAGASAPFSRPITVYDATESDAEIGLGSAHMVLTPKPQQGVVDVLEILLFNNLGKRTYVFGGQASADKPGGTLHFSQPTGAAGTRFLGGLSEDEVQWHEGGFCLRGPVFPGQRDVTYAYQLPLGQDPFRLERQVDYHINEMVVMTEGDQGTLSGPGVVAQGPVSVQGKPFKLYRASVAPTQEALELEIAGIGRSGLATLAEPRVVAGALSAGGLLGGLVYAVVLRPRWAAASSGRADEADEWEADDDAEDEDDSGTDDRADDERR